MKIKFPLVVALFVDLPEEEISLPCFTDPQFRLYYGLSGQGKRISDRIVHVIGYAYPDITFCPILLPIVSLFLHYVQVTKLRTELQTVKFFADG